MVARIPTCGRSVMANSLRNACEAQLLQTVLYVNNCDIEPYLNLIPIHKIRYSNTTGSGLDCLYQTVRKILSDTAKTGDDLLLIEDDVEVHGQLKLKLEALKMLIPEPKYLINLLNIPGRDAYYYAGKHGTPKYQYNDIVHRVDWVDGNFFASKTVVQELKAILPKQRPNYKKSSGVGQLISRYCKVNEIPIYQPIENLLAHADHSSVLFPEMRKKVPLIAKF